MLLNILARNNKIGLWCYFVGVCTWVMINRDRWGYLYCIVRGKNFDFLQDKLLQKHLARMIGSYFSTLSAPYEKSKSLGSGGNMVAWLKLKKLIEGHHQEWSLKLNLTQHGKTYHYQVQT
ncbi:hypothetical protein ACHAWX_006149 [Stephanocyclus meneghinianus]